MFKKSIQHFKTFLYRVFLFFLKDNLQSVFHNTISRKDDRNNTLYIIKTIHEIQDEGYHPAMVPSGILF